MKKCSLNWGIKMLRTLVKLYLRTLIVTLFPTRSKKKKMTPLKKAGIALLIILVAGDIAVAISSVFMQAAGVFCASGRNELYFCFTGLMCLLLGIFGSVFVTQSILYEAKDNELLLSMPIEPAHILAGRFIAVAATNYFYSAIMLIPAQVVYFVYAGFTVRTFFTSLIANILIPLMSLFICCMLAFLLSLISYGKRAKRIIQTVCMALILVCYMLIMGNIGKLASALDQYASTLSFIANKVVFPLKFYAQGATGSFFSLAVLAACVLIPIVLIYLILTESFTLLVGRTGTYKTVKYSRGGDKPHSLGYSFVKKEILRFFSSPSYFMNCGTGAIMAVAAAVFLLVKGDTYLAAFENSQIRGMTCIVVLAAMMFCAVTINTSSVSLSLEGKSFNILKAMPLRAGDIFAAKILTNLVIGLPPMVIASSIASFSLSSGFVTRLMLVVTTAFTLVLGSVFGMWMNLKFPRMQWENETLIIKQSTPVFIQIFSGIGLVAATCALYLALLSKLMHPAVYMLILCVVMGAVSVLIFIKKLAHSDERLLSI